MQETQFYSLEISSVLKETDEAICVELSIPEKLKEVFNFNQGQFLTLKENINGEEFRRPYSICSGTHEAHLRLGIKRVKNGLFSNHAHNTFKKGYSILSTPPQGNFFTELDKNNKKHYLFIAVGSGITPAISNIKTILNEEKNSRVSLLYGNKNTQSTIFLEELSFIKNKHMTRFMWVNIMTNEDQGSDILNGVIDNKKGAEIHRKNLVNIASSDEIFICGPGEMVQEVSKGLKSMGFDEKHIHYELFTSPSESLPSSSLNNQPNDTSQYKTLEKPCEVTIVIDGRSNTFGLNETGNNILEAGINSGLNLPYSCKAGICASCIAKITKGKANMGKNHILTEQQVKEGYILTCQAHPAEKETTIDFDQR